jgi:hypothetical protein
MTHDELLALLREARNELSVLASYVEDPDTKWPTAGLKVTAKAQKKLRDSIDAALAVSKARPAPPDLKWEEKESNRFGLRPHEADYSNNVFLTVEPHLFERNGWLWRVEYAGEAKNEEEAKAAAIAYAGRLP